MKLKSENRNHNSCVELDSIMLATVTNELQNPRSLSQWKCMFPPCNHLTNKVLVQLAGQGWEPCSVEAFNDLADDGASAE